MNFTRRGFLRAGTFAGALVPGRAATRALRLGGPIFLKSDDPVEMAREHRRCGYRAAFCPKMDLSDTVRIERVRQAFAAEDVIIAEVGAFTNMLDQDPEKRKANLRFVIEHLALADLVGARNCVNIAGSFSPNPKQWQGPDPRDCSQEFFDATVENCRKLIDAVKPTHTAFALEMMPWSPPDSAESYLKLIKAIDRPAFGAHVDICNLIGSPQQYFHNAELIGDVFQKLGRWIRSCHAKDLWGYKVHLAETVPGRGGIDYRAYLGAIAKYAPEAPLMLEHMNGAAEYDEGRRYIQQVAADLGLPLS